MNLLSCLTDGDVIEKGKRMREVLDSFYRSMDMTRDTLCDPSKSPCPIPPHMCAICTSSVFNVVPTEPHGHVKHPSSSSCSDAHELELPGFSSNLENRKQPQLLLEEKKRIYNAWRETSFDDKYEHNSTACLIYETTYVLFASLSWFHFV